jgi:hypothetical protein
MREGGTRWRMAWQRGPKGRWRLRRLKMGEDPSGGPTWARVDRELGQRGKNPKENENGLPTWFGSKCELGFRMDFQIDFKDFEFKSKGLNIFKPNFELRSN